MRLKYLVLGILFLLPALAWAQRADVVDTAVRAGSFKTLVAAVKAAGLESTLRGKGPFTIFAPSDEAFAQLPAETVQSLLKPENREKLVAILTYHVVSGKVRSTDLLHLTSAQTVNGKPLPIGLRVQNANVVQADIEASNGVIHVIDAVLIPPSENGAAALHSTKAPMTARAARQTIENAISEGSDAYNRGDVEACANRYMETAAALSQDETLANAIRQPLRRAVQSARNTHDANARAWAMRRALVRSYRQLSEH